MAETTDQKADSFDNNPDEVNQNANAQYSNNSDDSTDNLIQSFLKLKEHGQSSRTKALRLKENDVIVAIDGIGYHETIDNMVDMLSSGEDNDLWLLTIWRDGKFFEVFTRGPLGGMFEMTRPDESQMISDLFEKREVGEKGQYKIYEALRDVKRVVDVYDTSHNQIAVILPPIWLFSQKMWEPLLAIICVYLITFSVNIYLFVLAVILVGMYFRKGQVTLRRSYGMFQDRQVWAIIAARTDLEAQQMCRNIDEKVNFINSLVKPFKKNETQPRRKLKSGNVPKVPAQFM